MITMASRVCQTAPAWFVKCLTLWIFALVAAIFSGSQLAFAFVVAMGSLFAVHEMWRIVTTPSAIRFSIVLAVSMLLGYVLGAAVYLAYFQTIDATGQQYWKYFGLYFDQESLGLALAMVLFASGLLYAVSARESAKALVTRWEQLSTPKAARIVWLGILLVVAALAAGDIGYMGPTVAESGRVTALGALAVQVTPPLVPYTLALATGAGPFPRRCLLWVALVLLLGVTAVLGRRYLLYALALSTMVLFLRGHRLSLRRRAILVVLGAAAAILLYWGFKFFMALRLAVWEAGPGVSLGESVHAALSMLWGDQSYQVGAKLAENVGTRTFILSYLAGLVGIGSENMPALGRGLFYAIQMVVPSLLMPGKTANLPSSPEGVMHPLYGIPVFDGPNTIVVSGYDDFDFFGVLLYPLALAAFYSFFYAAVCRVVRDQCIWLFTICTLLFQLLYIEQSLSASLVTIRNSIIVIILLWIAMRMPTFYFDRPSRWPVRRAEARQT